MMAELSILVCLILAPDKCHEERFLQAPPSTICESEDSAKDFAAEWNEHHPRFAVLDVTCEGAVGWV